MMTIDGNYNAAHVAYAFTIEVAAFSQFRLPNGRTSLTPGLHREEKHF